MPRPVTLFTAQWTDLPLEELVQKTAEWGYDGLELSCWGDHFEVQRALTEDSYCQKKLNLLNRHNLKVVVVCRDCGIKFAFEVHPGQIAFDIYSAESTLDALDGRDEFGFTFDPSHFHWQGIDPAEFLRRFPDRIYHVHVKDAVVTLNGRNGILGSYLPYGDPRRGWDFRAPGRGGVDWEAVVRALNDVGYDGPLAV